MRKEKRKSLRNLSPSNKFIIYLLKQNGPLKQKDIIRLTLMPKRTVAYALKQLQDNKYIKKTKALYDKRISIFELIV